MTPKPDPPKPLDRTASDKTPGYSGLGANSLPKEIVAQHAPAPLDPEVSRRIQSMLDVRSARSGFLTSSGDRQFFTSRITGVDQVWRQDGPMSFPIQITGGQDPTQVVALAPDDSFIVVSRDSGGEENPGLYLLPIDGGALRAIIHAPKVQTQLQYVSDDARSLYYRANDLDPASYALYRYDVASRERARIFDDLGLWEIADHRGEDRWLLVKSLGNAHQEVYEYDRRTKRLTPVIGQGAVEEYQVAYGAKNGQVLLITNKLGNFEQLYALERGALTPITHDAHHDVEDFAIDAARTRIYCQINEDGLARLAVFDARTFARVPIPELPPSESVARASRDGRFAELVLYGSIQVPLAVSLDWKTGKTSTWRVPGTPELDPRTFAVVSIEHYPARDGTQVPMLVRRPQSCEEPCPVIVDFHGGPEAQSRPVFSPAAQLYVDAGFVHVQPNVRGSSGYGKAWLHADDGPRRLAVITDIEDVARFIRVTWSKNGRTPKIGVTGTSYGGYSALMAMTYFAGSYDAAVEQVGISDLTSFLANTAPYRRALRIAEYGDPIRDREALIQLSPITHIAKAQAPLLVIGGLNDPRVPIGESYQIYKKLEQRGVPSSLIIFPDEGHGALKRENVALVLGHSLAFFEKYLLGR
jgi:dipeptidyl aminopeptidase/acylaminoacyl peptidase